MVNAGRIWWTQPRSGVHWLGVVHVREHGRRLSNVFLSVLRQPFRLVARLPLQHYLSCNDLYYLSFRKLGHGRWRWWWRKCGRLAAHNFTERVRCLSRSRQTAARRRVLSFAVATSIQSAVGPAAADWLFAFSLTHSILGLGGNLAYVILVGVVCVGLGVSTHLPKNSWAHRKE